MLFHQDPFLIGKRPGFPDVVDIHHQLADVVHLAGPLQHGQVLRPQPHGPADVHGVEGDPVGMARGVHVLFFQGRLQGEHGVQGGDFQVFVVFFQQAIFFRQLPGFVAHLDFQVFLVGLLLEDVHPLLDGPLDLDVEDVQIFDGLGDEVVGPQVDGLDRVLHGARAGEEDHRNPVIAVVDELEGFKSVQAGHVDVEDDEVKIPIEGGQRLFAAGAGHHCVAEHGEDFVDGFPNQGVVVRDEDFCLCHVKILQGVCDHGPRWQ